MKIPLRSSTLLNSEIDDNCCFFRSILVSLYPCKTSHPIRVSNFRQNFDNLNIGKFHFGDEFKCSGVHMVEKKSLSKKLYELGFLTRAKWTETTDTSYCIY